MGNRAFIEQAQLAGEGWRVSWYHVIGWNLSRPADGVGTGWLIAPGLLLTNHHVIEARDQVSRRRRMRISNGRARRRSSGLTTIAKDNSYATVSVTEVVDSDRELDYALLRLADSAALSGREQIAVVRERPELPRGTRLNIVQCPGGGPLRYAIRNNFFVGPGQHPYEMRYLTDTRQGSSGSPVLNDSWQVVAMHKGYKKVDPGLFQAETGKSEVVKYHNEGIVITDILRRLPAVIRDEINNAQGWFAQVGSAVSTQRWDCGGGRTQI